MVLVDFIVVLYFLKVLFTPTIENTCVTLPEELYLSNVATCKNKLFINVENRTNKNFVFKPINECPKNMKVFKKVYKQLEYNKYLEVSNLYNCIGQITCCNKI